MTKDITTQENLKASSLLFFSLFIGCSFCSILCIDENKTLPGSLLAGYAVAFLVLTIWSNNKRFYPLLVGVLFYTALVITLVYFFPKIVAEGVSILSPYLYLMLCYLGFIYLMVNDYKKIKQTAPVVKKKETAVDV
ncbi:MAG: hypothetical protein K0R51_2600 [Cytophagaceae bacterium]|jgi:hypothetical protein|nr:hypothetical protein [Cytophagaceae bacterium]